MHEWALAESVILTVVNEATKHNLKSIVRVDLKIGELQQIDLDVFRFALENILQSQDTRLKMDAIALETVESSLKCRVCCAEWPFKDNSRGLQENETEAIHFLPEVAHTYLTCPQCGSPDFEILEGRGIWIESISGEY